MTSALSQCIEWVACRAGIIFYIFLSSKDKHETRIQCETCVTEEDTEKNTDSLLISMCDWGRKQWGMDRHYFFPCLIPLCMCIIRLPEKCLFCRL